MVYGVFSGEYSDWNVHGYFDSKEDAEAFCYKGDDLIERNPYYIIPIINLKDGDPEVYRKYTYWSYQNSVEDNSHYDSGAVSEMKEPTVVHGYRNGQCSVEVWMKPREFSEDRVRKIGQDMVAKYKARQALLL